MILAGSTVSFAKKEPVSKGTGCCGPMRSSKGVCVVGVVPPPKGLAVVGRGVGNILLRGGVARTQTISPGSIEYVLAGLEESKFYLSEAFRFKNLS